MNPVIPLRKAASILAAVAALVSVAQAVSPPPDGGYPGGNTAEGQNALFSLTTGGYNTAVGWLSLRSNMTSSFNTAIGAATLLANTAEQNTATGAGALLSTTIGFGNTANGAFALFSNTIGEVNTAIGQQALFSNTEGNNNTTIGRQALVSNTIGSNNTAHGAGALLANVEGEDNVASGFQALFSNINSSRNTAVGNSALLNHNEGCCNTAVGFSSMANHAVGYNNTAVGADALINNTSINNTALGADVGAGVTTASNVICIGAGVIGANVNNSCYIGNIWNQPGGSQAVYVNSDGKLGAQVSSQRFKEEIKPIEQTSEVIYGLRPVSFRYKAEIEPTRPLSFGLIAEDVQKISPNLVMHDADGKPASVRYDAVNAMLLNEFLKEHQRVAKQQARIEELTRDFKMVTTRQQKEIETLRTELKEQGSQIQKVGAHVKLTKASSRTVLNDQ